MPYLVSRMANMEVTDLDSYMESSLCTNVMSPKCPVGLATAKRFSVPFGEKTPRLLGEDFSKMRRCRTTGQLLIRCMTSSTTWSGLQNTERKCSMDRWRSG